MTSTIGALRKKDFGKAIDFAIEGMNFAACLNNPIALKLYGRYFFYLELVRATHVLAAYQDDRLVGILMAEMKGLPKRYATPGRKFYLQLFGAVMKQFAKDGPDVYEKANQKMLSSYLQKRQPAGEICFLAADPQSQGQGIGTQLLTAFGEAAGRGKEIYLYTDSNCSYPFYEKRGFQRAEEAGIEMKLGDKRVPLQCFLYRKRFA